MGKKDKNGKIQKQSPTTGSQNGSADDSYLSFFELFTRTSGGEAEDPCGGCPSKADDSACGGCSVRESTVIDSCGRSAAPEPVAAGIRASGPAKSPFTDLCGSCPSQGDADACSGCAQETGPESGLDCGQAEEAPLPEPTEEERAAVLAMDYETISRALKEEEPIAVAVATEFIVHYSIKVAEVLRNGEEFLHVVKPTVSTPMVECIAMDIVRSSVSASLQAEYHNQIGYGA